MSDNGFSLKSTGFAEQQAIPRRYTCDGEDVAPALAWSGAPEGTRSFALIMDDPDAPSGTFTHWLLANLPATVSKLDEAAPPPATEGENDFGRQGYGGPCPPRGHGEHRYRFHLYALDVEELGVAAGAPRDQLERAMAGHILAETMLVGRYRRE